MSFSRACVPAMVGRKWWDIFDYPACIVDQHFGTLLTDRDLHPPTYYRGNHLRARTLAAEQASGVSMVKNEKDKFQVKLSVDQFLPEEITVKVVDNHIVVHGKHEERSEEHGFIQREFTRRYVLPEGIEADAVKACMSESGVITIESPKTEVEAPIQSGRVVPISLDNSGHAKKDLNSTKQ